MNLIVRTLRRARTARIPRILGRFGFNRMPSACHTTRFRARALGPLTLALTLSLCLFYPTAGESQGADAVTVTNFPAVQTVDGRVRVQGPIAQTSLIEVASAVVAPVGRDETTSLILAGTLETSGFATAALSLAGQIKADLFSPGEVGALLLPDVPTVTTAFEEAGVALLSLTVRAPAASTTHGYFAAAEPLVQLGLPRYRVYFFNSTDRPAEVTLFAYLGN